MLLLAVVLAFLVDVSGGEDAGVTCRDKNGSPVDWFIVYKLPRLHKSPHLLVREGLAHYYMDVNDQHWTLSDRSLNDTKHALYYTLQQMYKGYKSKSLAYLLYNDEVPGGPTSFTHGHTKGDVVYDDQSGFWLVHSLPHFPPQVNTSYGYPHSGLVYGQTFICVTYPAKYFDLIGNQLLYTYPNVYDFNLPDALAKTAPSLQKVIEEKHVDSAPWNHQVELVSAKGQKFISFAKFTDWDADLYDAWIAPYFHSTVYTETWQNGRGRLDSNCTTKYQVLNVLYLNVGDVAFKETKDHSKWALTAAPGTYWVCIGDINRAEEQAHRAGGTLCSNLPQVWKAFNASITKLETCSSNRLKFRHENWLVRPQLINI